MSTQPRATVPARDPQPELIEPKELEAIRSAFRSGLMESAVGRLLDHVALQDRVIHAIAKRTDETGTAEEQARVAAAQELTDPEAPVHFRIEFDYAIPGAIGFPDMLEVVREWSLDHVVNLAVTGRVTATHRGSSESWEAGLP